VCETATNNFLTSLFRINIFWLTFLHYIMLHELKISVLFFFNSHIFNNENKFKNYPLYLFSFVFLISFDNWKIVRELPNQIQRLPIQQSSPRKRSLNHILFNTKSQCFFIYYLIGNLLSLLFPAAFFCYFPKIKSSWTSKCDNHHYLLLIILWGL
jgi:hypothetical protein